MRIVSKFAAAAAVFQIGMISVAFADDWRVTRLTGQAMVFYEGRWTPLSEDDIVADAAAVRTLADGSLRFERDRETIDVEPNTEIRILDRTGKRFTTVQQYFGTVAVEANRENVQHFAVKTPYLAAVVKGTVFAVETRDKVSAVAVTRGKVGVTGVNGLGQGDVAAGETATVSPDKGFKLGHGAASSGAASSGAASAAAAAAAAAASAASAAAAASSSAAAASTASAAAATASAATTASAASTGEASASSASAASSASSAAASSASSSATGHASASADASTASSSVGDSTGKSGDPDGHHSDPASHHSDPSAHHGATTGHHGGGGPGGSGPR